MKPEKINNTIKIYMDAVSITKKQINWKGTFRKTEFWGQIFSPWQRDIVDSGIELSYWPARLHSLIDRYDNPKPESTIPATQGLIIWLRPKGPSRWYSIVMVLISIQYTSCEKLKGKAFTLGITVLKRCVKNYHSMRTIHFLHKVIFSTF
jgi:hypothetical protein